ncbi:hypothetical protein D9M71_750710 [compost metagenome]
MGQVMETVKASDRSTELSLSETVITRASLVGWIASESVQITRPSRPAPPPPRPVETQATVTIEAINEPLALPYHGHRSEGLEFVDDAIKQLWSTYEEDKPGTAPTKDEVVEYLRSKGAGVNMAEAVNLILRPKNLKQSGLKNRRVPTRGD